VSRVTVSIDPHVRSDDSYDGYEPVELVSEHASEIGLDAVVITDHDVIGESKRAAEIADEYGYPGIAASDAHRLKYAGRAFTEVEIEGRESVDAVTADDVLDAIRNRTTRVDGRRAPVPMAARHYVGAAGGKSGYDARTGAVRSATAVCRGVAEVASTARVAVSQGTHRAARVLSWVT